ncbi:MAG: DUF4215 domain-containing protein [archaeon]
MKNKSKAIFLSLIFITIISFSIVNADCSYDVGINYGYSSSDNTGINIKLLGGDWILGTPVVLAKGVDYNIKTSIKNYLEEVVEGVHVIIKLDDTILSESDRTITSYTYPNVDLDISQLECDSSHIISVEIQLEGDCNSLDNYAERKVYVQCEEPAEPVCGNGILESGEECDDGNQISGDGCSSDCECEMPAEPECWDDEDCNTGYSCVEGICIGDIPEPVCGNGILESSEECDDGNSINGDECRNDCTLPFCGDGIIDYREECDDSNQISGDGCSSGCLIEASTPPVGDDNGIGGEIGVEDFEPKVFQCGRRILTDENVQPWRFHKFGDWLYERSGNYLFEGEKYSVDVVVWDKNKIQDVVVDLILGDEPGYDDYTINCIPSELFPKQFEKCNVRIDEEEIEEFDEDTMKSYRCSITILDSEHMAGLYWLAVQADDGNEVGVYDEINPLWINPIIELGVDGSLDFSDIRPGTSSYSQIVLTNEAEGGVALDMFITGKDWPAADSNLGRCEKESTGELVNYLPLEAFRYYAENGAFSTRMDKGIDSGYSSVIRDDADSEGYININKQLNSGFEEAMFNDAEIIQAGGPVLGLIGYRANVLYPGSVMALTFRLDLPESCYGEFESAEHGSIFVWAEAI